MTFTKAQQAQLDLARKQGVENTICRDHPEWGPTLMNLCWDLEKKGGPVQPAVQTGEWLRRNLPMHGGLIEDDPRIVLHVFKAFDADDVPAGPALKPDGSLDMDMYLFRIARLELIWNGSAMLWSGRVSVNDSDVFGLPVIMGEGTKQSRGIASQLQAWAAEKAEDKPARDAMDRMAGRQISMLNVLLALDDMNIRGYQIPYALEYAGGSVEILYGLLEKNRSEDLCDYINMRSAKDYLDGNLEHNQAAVPSGASFCHDGLLSEFAMDRSNLNFTQDSAQKYARSDIRPLDINWSELDIISGLDLEQAEKIMAARGFQLVRKVERKDRHDGAPVYGMIWYEPERQDYVTAPSAREDNACYGGMRLTLHRDPDTIKSRSDFWWKCSSGPDKNQDTRYFEFGCSSGLFRYYTDACAAGLCNPDWKKISFDAYGIPVPEYFKLPILRRDMIDTGNANLDVLLYNMGRYYLEDLINNILCYYDAELENGPSPHYREYYKDWFLSDGIACATGWRYNERSDLAMLCAAAFAWLEVPDDMIRQFTASLDYENPEEFLDGAALAAGIVRTYGLPGPATLPVRLPWLEKR